MLRLGVVKEFSDDPNDGSTPPTPVVTVPWCDAVRLLVMGVCPTTAPEDWLSSVGALRTCTGSAELELLLAALPLCCCCGWPKDGSAMLEVCGTIDSLGWLPDDCADSVPMSWTGGKPPSGCSPAASKRCC